MDKIYIDKRNKTVEVELPKYGEIKIVVQDGKVVRTETTSSQKVD